MSAENLIIDDEALLSVANSITDYVTSAKNNLEAAMRGLQAAESCWSDNDMRDLQESLQLFYSEVEQIGAKGTEIALRCQRKLDKKAQLHNMRI